MNDPPAQPPVWLPTAEALRIVARHIGVNEARAAIAAGARAGSIGTRARRFMLEVPNACGQKALLEENDVELPREFWSTSEPPALGQDWGAGAFSTWVRSSFRWQAFGVGFDQAGICALVAARGAASTG